MFGDATHRPQVPAAWFSKFAMKHTAPPSSKIYSMPGAESIVAAVRYTDCASDGYWRLIAGFEDVALSSFLSLGPDEDDGKFNSGQVGAALSAWVCPFSALSCGQQACSCSGSYVLQTEGERLSVGPNPGLTDDFSLFWMDKQTTSASTSTCTCTSPSTSTSY